MKKIISIILALCIIVTMFTFSASAFGGYMHWTIASIRMDLDDALELDDDIKLAYKSGCLLADIGAALMDHYKDFDTDKFEFTQAIYDLAISQNSELGKAFAFGWRDHYLQDNLGDAHHLYNDDGSWGPYDNYLINYGWIDEFLRDEYQLIDDYPIQSNSISEMYVNYDLIQGAYRRLGDSAPLKTTINANIISMCIMFDTLILLNTKTWTSEQISRILLETLVMAFSSYGINEVPPPESVNKNSEPTNEKLSFSEQVFSLITEQEMTELSQYYSIESTPISDGEALLTITNNNIENYNNTLNRIVCEKTSIINEFEID